MEDANKSITFIPDVPVKTGIETWSMKITDESGRVVEEYNQGALKDEFEYDGKLNGGYIPEGKYKGILTIRYINGNNPTAESPSVVADKTVPSASAKTTMKVFSPNGDGNKDVIGIYQETSEEDVWYAEIKDSSGKLIQNFKWVKNAESSINWDGYTKEGSLAPDGAYTTVCTRQTGLETRAVQNQSVLTLIQKKRL